MSKLYHYTNNGTGKQEINELTKSDITDFAHTHELADLPSNIQNVQPDWNQTDDTKDDFIKGKPTISSYVPGKNGGFIHKVGGSWWETVNSTRYGFYIPWQTPDRTYQWNTDLQRVQTAGPQFDALKNAGSNILVVNDYIVVAILSRAYVQANICSYFYAELFLEVYDDTDTKVWEYTMDTVHYTMIDTGVGGIKTVGAGIYAKGFKHYDLYPNWYSKIKCVLSNDNGAGQIEMRLFEHEHSIS